MNKLVKIVLAVITTALIAVFVLPILIFSTATGQKAFLWLEDAQVAHFYFKNEDASSNKVYMKGVIYANTLDDLKEMLAKHPTVNTIVMEDVPGSIDDEVNLLASREIRNKRISTHIPSQGAVASGGTDMFLAGYKRTIEDGAKLGVHSWADTNKTAREYAIDDDVHNLYLDYYREINIPEAFYWYTLDAAPADDIFWMTKSDILQYNVVTEPFDKALLISTLKVLSSDDMRGRSVGKNQLAQQLIIDRFNTFGLKSFHENFTQTFSFTDEDNKKRLGTNLVGYIKGNDKPDEYIVIGAHYDHMGVVDNEIFNGADDNASGTSAVLSLLEYFSLFPPKHSIIFIAYDAEELGLFGSRYFVDNPPIDIEKIKLKFNFDMIGRNINNEIFIVGTHQYPMLKPYLMLSAKSSSLKVSFGHDIKGDKSKDYWMESSDNAPYFLKNIPNITFSEEDHPDYHKATDDFEKIDIQFYQEVVDLISSSIRLLDNELVNVKLAH